MHFDQSAISPVYDPSQLNSLFRINNYVNLREKKYIFHYYSVSRTGQLDYTLQFDQTLYVDSAVTLVSVMSKMP
jgi:hypothetical protein